MSRKVPTEKAAAKNPPAKHFDFDTRDIPIEKLLLDPNNYRFLDRAKFKKKVVTRFHEDSVQRSTLEILEHLTFPKCYASSTGFLKCHHESAYLLAKGEPRAPEHPIPDVIEWHYTGNRLHPSQKAVETLMPLIESFSKPGDTVLDPFAGSASTLLAAKKLGRDYIGIEMDATYHAVAKRRLKSSASDPL
jgi:DNA modification methylase